MVPALLQLLKRDITSQIKEEGLQILSQGNSEESIELKKKIRHTIGGNIEAVYCGGAFLDEDTIQFYKFIGICLIVKKNIIFVANGWDTQLQYGHDFRLADFHFITEPLPVMKGDEPMPIQFKVRHVDHFMPGFISLDDEGYHIHSAAPIQGIAPGQFGCIYDADATICYGSGEIGIYKTP